MEAVAGNIAPFMPPGWSRPIAGNYDRLVRSTVTAGGHGTLVHKPTVASRNCFAGRSRTGTAAIDYRIELWKHHQGQNAGGIGIEITGAGDWYFWQFVPTLSQVYKVHEVASAPSGALLLSNITGDWKFWKATAAEGSGSRSVGIYASVDGVTYDPIESTSLDVAAVGVCHATAATNLYAQNGINAEYFVGS